MWKSLLSDNQTSAGPIHRASHALLETNTKKGAIKIESNDSPLENQRTNNYAISEEGPEGHKSVSSTTSTHIWSNYSEEFFKLRNTMIGNIISEPLT